MKKQNKQKGITLIALVITIIILLILAGVSISALTDSGLFAKAKLAKQKSENAQAEENATLKEYEDIMNGYISGTGGSSSGDSTGEGGGQTPVEEQPATTITEAQSDYMLTKTVNSQIEDTNGNKIVVPAGFKIKVDDTTNNATTVDQGVVITDSNENEFVWIPVGTITKADGSTVEINLNRYTFASDGTASAYSESVYSDSYVEEDSTDTENLLNYGNTIAKNINAFKTSVETNGGYYIGRYEARTATERSSKSDELTTITVKGTDYVYNYVTQPQAATLCRNMYTSCEYTSDLMNSYSWDTTTLFLQSCGTNATYSMQTSLNTTLANTGTNNTEKQDIQCNVYDIASNIMEWTTETSSISSSPCSYRGGIFDNSSYCTYYRRINGISNIYIGIGFRPLLYL